jgi:hypothetical protein
MQTRAHQTTPILVSDDGRYFVRPGGEPFFWLGDTQWELFRLFSLKQVEQILDSRRSLGFTCLQIMLVGVDPLENIEGQRPWLEADPLKPNEKYFAHVDRVIDLCRSYEDLALVLGIFHTVRMKGQVNAKNARPWARWVAERYGGVANIVWSMYPRAVQEDVPVCQELARGLSEGDGGSHLITVHPDPSPASSSAILHEEPWLAFNSIQTHKDIHLVQPMVTEDYLRRPTKPVVMAEGAYEAGTGYGGEVTPLWLRRQAYYTHLSGGYHTYGHEGFWRVQPSWEQALGSPGARQMGVLKTALWDRAEWWRLTPDQELLATSEPTGEGALTLAARHAEGSWAVAYTGSPSRFSVAMDKVGTSTRCEAFWVDPRSGESSERRTCASCGEQTFSTPDGWEDGLLVLEVLEQ